MTRHWTRSLLAVTAAAVTAIVVPVGTTNAAASKPTATFSFVRNRVTAGQSTNIKYATTGVPRGASVVLQRQYGTAHTWRQVKLLQRSGTTSVPPVSMGQYAYRIAVVKQRTLLAHSRGRWLYSYGTTYLSTLCNSNQIEFDLDCYDGGTAQVGTTVFPYQVYDSWAAIEPNYDQVLVASASTCRSITVEWGIDNDSGAPGDTATLQITRADADPVAATVDYGVVGTLTAPLDRNAWAMNVWSNNDSGVGIAIDDASLSCYTRSGMS